MRVLVAGCGWLGTAVARALVSRGDRVIGIRRSEKGASALRRAGIEPLRIDLADPSSAALLPVGLDAVVACQSADSQSPEAYRRAYVDANRVLLEGARRAGAGGFVYTGSTGVFGYRDGREVDEETDPQPSGPTGPILADAERLVLDAATPSLATRVVRLSGLYGPGRVGVIERVRSGRMALGPGDDAWTNWCHLHDAVTGVLAILDRGRSQGVYHGTDAEPTRRREVVSWIASGLGIAPPRKTDGQDGPDSAPRGANRRIRGERTRAELGIVLRYPSFREGLAPYLPSPGA